MTAFGPELPRFAELAPGVRRVLAPNPSMMTGPGTNTYLFGIAEIAVIDPGPDIGEHIDRIIDTAGAPIRWVLVTHTHPDHSPGAMSLATRSGAELVGRPPPDHGPQDRTFRPARVLDDGDRLETGEFVLEAVHTPGHASNHLCYRHEETNWLVTGDQVIDGSTVVINPPDGDMRDYIESLRRLRMLNGAGERLLGKTGDAAIDRPAHVGERVGVQRRRHEAQQHRRWNGRGVRRGELRLLRTHPVRCPRDPCPVEARGGARGVGAG